jgi:hypothetical protein
MTEESVSARLVIRSNDPISTSVGLAASLKAAGEVALVGAFGALEAASAILDVSDTVNGAHLLLERFLEDTSEKTTYFGSIEL